MTVQRSVPIDPGALGPDDVDLEVRLSTGGDGEALVALRSVVSRRLVGVTDRDVVETVGRDALRTLLGGTAALVLGRDGAGRSLRGVDAIGLDPVVVRGVSLDLAAPDSPWRLALHGEVAAGAVVVDGTTHSAWFVPMGPDGGGSVLAVLGAGDESWSPTTVLLAAAVADELHTVLHRIRLVEQHDARIDELEQRYQGELRTVARLVDLDRMRTDRVEGLTHDLKEPLTALVGFVETLRRMDDRVSADQRRQFLGVMSRQASQLVHLVEDLLLSARIEADAAARRRDPIGVASLVHDTVGAMAPAEAEGVSVELAGDAAREVRVVGDRLHLSRVLQNLLGNAVRHGGGRMLVSVEVVGREVAIGVEDDGPGVPPELAPRIFDRFGRGDAEGSTGLGLYVARGIAEAHDGRLVLEEPAVLAGARFTLWLPLGDQSDTDDDAPAVDRRRGPRATRTAGRGRPAAR